MHVKRWKTVARLNRATENGVGSRLGSQLEAFVHESNERLVGSASNSSQIRATEPPSTPCVSCLLSR